MLEVGQTDERDGTGAVDYDFGRFPSQSVKRPFSLSLSYGLGEEEGEEKEDLQESQAEDGNEKVLLLSPQL